MDKDLERAILEALKLSEEEDVEVLVPERDPISGCLVLPNSWKDWEY